MTDKLTPEQVAEIEARHRLPPLIKVGPSRYEIDTEQVSRDFKALLASHASLVAELNAREWRTISEAPSDVILWLGWEATWKPDGGWEYAADMADSTRGGWRHGKATHFMLITPPTGN